MEEVEGGRKDGSKRAGFYRITKLGVAFARNRARAPKYANIYAQECLGVSDETTTIVEALGKSFNYRDLMQGI